jgi:hypothetical protein
VIQLEQALVVGVMSMLVTVRLVEYFGSIQVIP